LAEIWLETKVDHCKQKSNIDQQCPFIEEIGNNLSLPLIHVLLPTVTEHNEQVGLVGGLAYIDHVVDCGRVRIKKN